MIWLSICSPILPLVLGWRQRGTSIWFYALVSILVDLVVYSFKHVFQWEYYWLGNVFLFLEFILLNFYYRDRVLKNKTLSLFIVATGCVLFTGSTIYYYDYGLKFNYIANSFSNFYFIALAILGFYFFLKKQEVLFFEQSTFFWVNTAILVYASGSFFIFLFRNTIQVADPKAMSVIWSYVFLSLNILKNILLGIALSKKEGT